MRNKSILIIVLSVLLSIILVLSGCTTSPSTTSTDSTSTTSTSSSSTSSPSSSSSSSSASSTSSSTSSLGPITPTTAQPLATITDVVAAAESSVVIINDQISATNAFNQVTTASAAGSGWIIRSDGYVVTNAHVVEGATNIVITLHDGRTIPADNVYTDDVTDLAIVKINATNLPALTVADSSVAKVGDSAIAIGNALGQGTSATAGIVSALHISLSPAPGQLIHDLIQTDAAINPGNSGGPLLNMAAQVIGINSYKVSQEGVEGMGYAININEALPVLNSLIVQGCIVRPYLGIDVYTIDQTIANYYGLAVDQGVLITDVATGSPADNAGLQPGDVITAIDGKAQNDDAAMMDYVNSLKVGQKIEITYYRGTAKDTVTVTLVQSPCTMK
jgi:serine protease Do